MISRVQFCSGGCVKLCCRKFRFGAFCCVLASSVTAVELSWVTMGYGG